MTTDMTLYHDENVPDVILQIPIMHNDTDRKLRNQRQTVEVNNAYRHCACGCLGKL